MTEPIGGDLSLDFHNTVSWAAGQPVESETLNSYEDLVNWEVEQRLLTAEEAEALTMRARGNPELASRAHVRALELRQVLGDAFRAIARGSDVEPGSLDRFNTFLGELPLKLGNDGSGGVAWDWTGRESELGRVLWPVIWAAASLLRSDEARWVGECANDRCGWLFVDRSRRRNRKWCNMRDCGNRAKARRHYARHKKRNPR